MMRVPHTVCVALLKRLVSVGVMIVVAVAAVDPVVIHRSSTMMIGVPIGARWSKMVAIIARYPGV